MISVRSSTAFFFAFTPLLSIYATGLPSLSISELIFVFFYFLLLKKQYFKILSGYFVYTCIITILSVVIGRNEFSTAIFETISLLLSIIMLNYAIKTIDINLFKKYTMWLTYIVIAFFVFQYSLYTITGSVIPGLLPLPLANGVSLDEFKQGIEGGGRCCSIFSEPAHLASFLLIPLVFILFSKKTRKSYILFAVIIIIAIVTSESACGMAGLGVVLLYYMRYKLDWIKAHKFISLSAIMCITLLAMYKLADSILNDTLNRFVEISGDAEVGVHGHSSYLRVVRGYIPFEESPFFFKIFGSGVGSLETILKNTTNTTYFSITSSIPLWINTMQSILISTGLVGLFIVGRFLYRIYKTTDIVGKALLASSVSMFLGASGFFPFNFIVACFYAIVVKSFDINKEKIIHKS